MHVYFFFSVHAASVEATLLQNLPGYVNYTEIKKRRTDMFKSPEKFVEFAKPHGFQADSIHKNITQTTQILDRDLLRQRYNGLDKNLVTAATFENLSIFANLEAPNFRREFDERLTTYVDSEMQTSSRGSPAASVSEPQDECFERPDVSIIKCVLLTKFFKH